MKLFNTFLTFTCAGLIAFSSPVFSATQPEAKQVSNEYLRSLVNPTPKTELILKIFCIGIGAAFRYTIVREIQRNLIIEFAKKPDWYYKERKTKGFDTVDELLLTELSKDPQHVENQKFRFAGHLFLESLVALVLRMALDEDHKIDGCKYKSQGNLVPLFGGLIGTTLYHYAQKLFLEDNRTCLTKVIGVYQQHPERFSIKASEILKAIDTNSLATMSNKEVIDTCAQLRAIAKT